MSVVPSLATLVLAVTGVPLFVVIAAGALLSFYLAGIDTSVVIIEMYRLASTPTLVAIPLFTFAGYVLAESNAPKRLVRVSRAFLGWLPGGLAVVVLVACTVFTAFTGASGVTIIALGGLVFPALTSQKYSERFSLGLITTSGPLGLLLPPSLPLILYGIVSKTSIDRLFKAGILPASVLAGLLVLYSIVIGRRERTPVVRVSVKEMGQALFESIWEIPLPFVVLGGIYTGYFAVSDAAAITAFYVLFVEMVIYREVPLKTLASVVKESMVLVGGILIILGAALAYTSYLIDAQVPMKLLAFIEVRIASRWAFLILLNIFLLIVGCMIDVFSALVVVVPLILPLAHAYGIEPIHLGIIFLTNLGIGYSTPPVGMNLFIASYRFNRPILTLYLASLPFLGILLVGLIIVTYLPGISLFWAR
ncbi:MAG: TRAP transporter large permease subunit [Deltaproteobacteria bacterium]|nr:TRAP transporter large permease subunit [Deltaproteobacteria bacterium]MBW2122562.1 TRAP transporter large permease subunit [Deltaproteobacteria bacterium]